MNSEKERFKFSADRLIGVESIYTTVSRMQYVLPEGVKFSEVVDVSQKYDQIWITLKDGSVIETFSNGGDDARENIDWKHPSVEFDNDDLHGEFDVSEYGVMISDEFFNDGLVLKKSPTFEKC